MLGSLSRVRVPTRGSIHVRISFQRPSGCRLGVEWAWVQQRLSSRSLELSFGRGAPFRRCRTSCQPLFSGTVLSNRPPHFVRTAFRRRGWASYSDSRFGQQLFRCRSLLESARLRSATLHPPERFRGSGVVALASRRAAPPTRRFSPGRGGNPERSGLARGRGWAAFSSAGSDTLIVFSAWSRGFFLLTAAPARRGARERGSRGHPFGRRGRTP